MAQSLTDLLKPQLTKQASTAQPGEGQRLANLLRTKQTGKASVGGSAPKASTLGEEAAIQETKVAGTQQALAGQLQAQSFTQQESDLARQQDVFKQELEEKRQTLLQSTRQQTNTIIDQANRENRQLTYDKDAAKLEQLAFTMRLEDDKYVFTLQDIGRRQRLADSIAEDTALKKAVLEDNYELFSRRMDMNAIMAADDRTFQREMQKVNLDFAREMADKEMKAESKRRQAAAIKGILMPVGGGSAVSQIASSSKGSPTTTTSDAPVMSDNVGAGDRTV